MSSNGVEDDNATHRAGSFSQASATSQTAQEFISAQLSLEADAREALPYQFDTCTKPLGPLRQSIYACLTCTPPPASKYQQFIPAGVCYSCSISCHGEHNLVELFGKRDFECDCGTTRLSTSGTSCTLRLDTATGRKGGVSNDVARSQNKYNQNFEGRFCGCGEEYDPEQEKGTMFQCLGLGHVAEGGCGEDWWHPECLMGLPRMNHAREKSKAEPDGRLETLKEEETEDGVPATNSTTPVEAHEDDAPPGFPCEEDFDHLICYKCTEAFSWIKQYAGTCGFLSALPAHPSSHSNGRLESYTKKRRADDEPEESQESPKKARLDEETFGVDNTTAVANSPGKGTIDTSPKHQSLPTAPATPISLFAKDDFRDHLCRCADCFPRLVQHPQLLEEEDTYEPPVSECEHNEVASVGGRSVNSGSLLDRGEAALSSMDRVRAIEGVMAYNHVRDKVKAFLQPFAESGQPVGAEDIKAYFAKLRGDEHAGRESDGAAEGGAVQGDGRREQDGY